MSPQWLQAGAAIIAAYAALFGGIWAVLTAPLLRLIKAESALIKAEIKAEMAAMELRLSERFADKLADHGERIRSLEERRFQ